MRALSSLGDAALLLPASALLLAYRVLARQAQAAGIWAVALIGCGLATLVAKLAFHACGPALSDFDVVSPSGHASLATTFYGALAILIGSGRPRSQKAALAGASLALLGLVGVSRVATAAHSPEEVVLGFLIGAACVALFRALHRRAGHPSVSPVPLTLGFLLALALLGGRHFSLEAAIGGMARRIAAIVDVCTANEDSGTRS